MNESEKHALVAGCIRALEQCQALVGRLDDRLYAETNGLPIQSGVGEHLRHCLDFFQSLIAGIGTGRVDYNRRERDPLVASDRAWASARIEVIIEELRSLAAVEGDTPLLVSPEDACGTDVWCASTLARELQFLLSHHVHHNALIALILRLQGFEPGEGFGVAPSTLAHWRREALCAR
jgi:uncharacterized damage-inducible protein DinB